MDTMQTERKYALIKIETGDYLLPGNDGKTLWRIRRGVNLHIGPDGIHEVEIPCWNLWRWTEVLTDSSLERIDLDLEWSGQWDFDLSAATRQEAIEEALHAT